MKADRPAKKPRLPRGRGAKQAPASETNQATTEDLRREGLGIAPKE